MAPPESYDSLLTMVSAHEDRIQRLESGFAELASSVAEQNATMKAFSQQMRMMSDSVVEKLEDVSSRLSDKIGVLHEVTKEAVHEGNSLDKRLAILERGEVKSGKRFEWWMALVASIIAVAVGSGATVLIEHLAGK